MESSATGMKSLARRVKSSLIGMVRKVFMVEEKDIPLTMVTNNTSFEYTCPHAIRLFQNNKQGNLAFGLSSAEELARKLATALAPEDEIIDKLDVAPGGMLQVRLKDSVIEHEITNILRQGVKYGEQEKQNIVVDFSSPNIAKEMHVGHLRSTIIGESICRILEFLGHQVHRVNHVGDWGTQFGMLIQYMREAYPDYQIKTPELKDLDSFYKAAKKRFDEDAEFKKKSQLNVVALQGGDPECRKTWQAICELSRVEYLKIYKRLNIKIDEVGESFYNDMIPSTVQECKEKKMVVEDDGAQCIFIKDKPTPLMVIKSDGGYNYDSTDLAAAKYRLETLRADRIIIFTDSGQYPHFELIFKAAELAGWHKPPKTRMDHGGFGLIQGEDGKKFKTRKGDAPRLMDLLDEAHDRAEEDLKKRLEEQKESVHTALTESEISISAEKIGMAAVKYYDLRQNRISSYRFAYDKMLDAKGNTAVYLLYSFARISSIIRKSGYSEDYLKSLAEKQPFRITHPHERYLALALLRFPETLDVVTDEIAIHKLCDLIYDIATKVSEGYAKFRILDDPAKDTRIQLCEATRLILSIAFHLVGIDPLEKI